MSPLLLVIIILIILFLVYFYRSHIVCRRKKVPTKIVTRHNGDILLAKRYSPSVRTYPLASASVSLGPGAIGASLEAASFEDESDCDSDEELDDHLEVLSGRYDNFSRQRARALNAGIFADDVDGSLFTKTSTAIINDITDEESGTFGTLFRSEKALALKNHLAAMPVADNEIFSEMMTPDGEILASLSIENWNDGAGQQSMIDQANNENAKVIKSEIFTKIQRRESEAIEGVTDRDFTQIQVVPQSMAGGRPPPSATLKKLTFESTNPDVQAFMSSMAQKDIEIRKEIAGNSNNSIVDQSYIASDFIQ